MSELLAVVTITMLAVISPGPDFAMVTRNSVVIGRRAGVLTAIGIGGGVLVHVSYTMLGVGLLIQQSLLLFNIIKVAGAAYLVWLGIKMLCAKPSAEITPARADGATDAQAIRMGFLTNVLNPKTTIFVVSLYMQVVGPRTPLPVQLGYGGFIAGAHVLWFGTVALFLSADGMRASLLKVRHRVDHVFGGILVVLGALLATSAAR